MASYFARKPIADLQMGDGANALKRVLGAGFEIANVVRLRP